MELDDDYRHIETALFHPVSLVFLCLVLKTEVCNMGQSVQNTLNKV